MAKKFFGGNFTSAIFTTITGSCAGKAVWETHMKTSGVIPFMGLMLVVTVTHGTPVRIDSQWRSIAVTAGGSGTTNLSTTAVGLLQATFIDSNVCGCLPFPGYGFNLEAGASQNTSVGLTSNGVLSIVGQGRAHALTTLTVANQYGAVAASSALDVQFTLDQPLPYSVTANLSHPVGKAYVYLVRKSGNSAWPVFGFGHTYFNTTAPSTGGISGVLLAGTYQFVAGIEGGAYAQSGDGYFDVAFTVTPPLPPSAPPAPTIRKTAEGLGLALSWPVSLTNVLLEATDSLTTPASWTGSTNEVTQSNGMFSVTIDMTAPSQFFRLRTL